MEADFPMYDLIVKGGTVVDPSQNLHGVSDVAIEDGKIAKIAPDIPAAEAKRVVEVKGKVVTPGLIDLHTHVYAGPLSRLLDVPRDRRHVRRLAGHLRFFRQLGAEPADMQCR
ncbi:MAG: hypothetical protein IIC89_02045 [Chloroflexi bacterium]|nr:hypothetical protein [Chloroflexota bacterium]